MSQNDTQFRIGKLLDETARRDAVHIAVLPVTTADKNVYPGVRVKLLAGTTDQVVRCINYDDPGIGIVDPFLAEEALDGFSIKPGQRFWVFLNPNTVTGMRHSWEHPVIDRTEILSEAETWLRRFADRWGMDYENMIETASDPDQENDEWGPQNYITAVGRNLHGAHELNDGEEELFWQNLALLTGKSYDQDHRAKICWTCTC